MEEQKWTHEPWSFTEIPDLLEPSGEDVHNRRRIVACVNACQGIPDPSVIPEIIRQLLEEKECPLRCDKVSRSGFHEEDCPLHGLG